MSLTSHSRESSVMTCPLEVRVAQTGAVRSNACLSRSPAGAVCERQAACTFAVPRDRGRVRVIRSGLPAPQDVGVPRRHRHRSFPRAAITSSTARDTLSSREHFAAAAR